MAFLTRRRTLPAAWRYTAGHTLFMAALASVCSAPVALGESNVKLPRLTVRDVGCYGMVPWPPPGKVIQKGDRYDRTKDLNFAVMCVWVRTDEAAEQIDLSELAEQIEVGWNSSPRKTVLLRIDFWGSNGRERYTGQMAPFSVYARRIDAVLDKLAAVIHKLQGISLSEENILSDGRPAMLRDLYWHVKRRFPDLPVYQWWTPMTAVPGTYEGVFLPADGWIVDPYYHCKGYYGQSANIRRYVQKYLVTGLPLVFMLYATNYPPFYEGPIQEWDVIEEQLRLCEEYNLPVAWFWTYSSTHDSGGTTHFGHPTGDPLMDRISQRVLKWCAHVRDIPADYDGNPAVADVWKNPPLSVAVIPGANIIDDDFHQSYFLDQTSGTGFRDLVWDGQSVGVRGHRGRAPRATMTYRLVSDFPMQWPLVIADVIVDPERKGQVTVEVSNDNGTTWAHATTSIANRRRQRLRVATKPDPSFKETRSLHVRISLQGGNAGSDEVSARIEHLTIRNLW